MSLPSVVSDAFKESEQKGVDVLLENAGNLFRGPVKSIEEEAAEEKITKKQKVDAFLWSGSRGSAHELPESAKRTSSGGLVRKERVNTAQPGDVERYYNSFFECEYCGSFDCDASPSEVVCRECGTSQFQSQGYASCENCEPGYIEFDDYVEACQQTGVDKKRCVYRRSAYLDDLLDQFMGTTRKMCPEHVFQTVADELGPGCSIEEVRECLRSKQLSKHYKFAGEIASRLRVGQSSSKPKLNQQELQFFKVRISQTERAFEAVRGDRKNFLNFRYVALQLLSMLGRDDLIMELPPLKNKYRIKHHDQLWEKICRFCGWEFDPVLK